MEPHLHYDPEVDIALISLEDGRAIGERHPWGLIERHPDDGHLMGFEIWGASKIFALMDGISRASCWARDAR